MEQKFGIHWFRRDLTLVNNPALWRNWQQNQGRVLGLFCIDRKFLARPDFSPNRFAFFLQTLHQLKAEMQELGGELLIIDSGPQDFFQQLEKNLTPSAYAALDLISWNRDYEPFARKRDQEVISLLEKKSLPFFHARHHLIIEPEELAKDKGYKVYTPFMKKWYQIFVSDTVQARLLQKFPKLASFSQKWKAVASPAFLKSSALAAPEQFWHELSDPYLKTPLIKLPAAGTTAALTRLGAFCRKGLDDYETQRDLPAEQGTSQLSIYLKNGSLTTSLVARHLTQMLRPHQPPALSQFLKEIIWREFYYHILYWYPAVEHEAFQLKYRQLQWENPSNHFQAWKDGLTGFPIIDAGMRQLKQTGWMHNRIRMVVASFLVKDLLVDWRWGEQYFMQELLDGDLAPNNGGWQWCASTGTDACPYFRIFNPWNQSLKFDPDGRYIKKFVPELKDYPSKKLHVPILDSDHYPRPIVTHSEQRTKALLLFK
jgi:deoxyribodipyrimidine photo-lyase